MNRREIEDIINTSQPEDELNEMAIYGYCKAVLGIRIAFRKDAPNLSKITLAQFQQYVNDESLQRGEVVFDVEQNGMGIIHSANFTTLSLMAYVDSNGRLHEKPVEVPRAYCRAATEKEKFEIQRKLHRAGLGWNKRKFIVFRQGYVPQENQQVRLSVLGQKMGLGVFKEFDSDSRIVMYCVKMVGEQARYSLHEVIGKAEDYQIDMISTYERNIFTEDLKKAGVLWNGHIKQIKVINHRVAKGETYYYVDDLFMVVAVTDKYKPRDNKRLAVGNYFATPDRAERLQKVMLREAARGVDKAASVGIPPDDEKTQKNERVL